MIALIAAVGVTFLLVLTLVRQFGGPTLYDRALATSSVISKAALICAALAVAFGETAWIDVAFALTFAGLVLNVAILKFFRVRTFQAPMVRAGRDG